MKTFKQFNEEARQHLDEIDRNMGGLGLGVKIASGVANVAKKVTVGGVRRAIGAAAKTGQLIAAPIAFGLNFLKGIAQGKHKKRRIFKKEGS